MRYSKTFNILSLTVMSLLLCSFTYAYWIESVQSPQPENIQSTIQLGGGAEVNTALKLSVHYPDSLKDKRLVPLGLAIEEDEVDHMSFNIAVGLTSDHQIVEGKKGYLSLDKYEHFIVNEDGEEIMIRQDFVNLKHNVKEDSFVIADDRVFSVFVDFEIQEPLNKEEYDLVKNHQINTRFYFSVDFTPSL